MLLTTLSTGANIHSALLTEFAVTGCYQVCPGIFKKNISTQQSTWMALKDGSSATVALEDGGDAAALGGGVGRQFKIAAAALGGGGSRRIFNNGVGVSIVEAKGFLEIGVLRWWWRQCDCKDGAGKARVRGQWHGTRPAQAR
jgi:hypothetical protein